MTRLLAMEDRRPQNICNSYPLNYPWIFCIIKQDFENAFVDFADAAKIYSWLFNQ